MDSELVSDSLSSSFDKGNELIKSFVPTDKKTYTEIFEHHFPFYLSIGMTIEQYWDEDCNLVKYYRKASEISIERQNTMLWLQGMYIYDALSRLAPIFHAFAKKGTKARSYVEEPYPISKQSVEQKKENKEKANYNKSKVFMETFMAKTNKAFDEFKKGSE